MLSKAGIRFDIEPEGAVWRWTTFDLAGRRLNGGDAGSKREAAAFVIREIMRARFAELGHAADLPAMEAA